MTKRTTYLSSIGFLALAALLAPSAQAAYLVTLQEVGSDVIETGSGSLDLRDLNVGIFGIDRDASVTPILGRFFSGVFTDANTSFAVVSPILPLAFGPGQVTMASSTSGGPVGLVSGLGDNPTLIFPIDYISGTALSDSSTYLGATISSMGMTPGDYVFGWGSGDHADTLTIDIIASTPPAVPEPSSWAMMLIGFSGLGFAAVRRKGAVRAISA
jgi:PEP-CTERM motif